MIIEDHNGNKIDTDKFDDIKAMVYEDIANLHNKLKQYGLSFLTAIKYSPENVVGSVFLKQGEDFIDLIQYVNDQLLESTDGEYGIRLVHKNELGEEEDEDYEDEEEDEQK